MNYHQLLKHVYYCLVIAFSTIGILSADDDFSWENKEIEGERYVPVNQIGQFYRLGDLVRDGSSLKFENDMILMELEVGSRVLYMNTVKIILSKPIVESGNTAYVSGVDLAVLVESILRPDRIAVTGDLNTVILDPANDPESDNGLSSGSDYTLAIANITKMKLEVKGFTVSMTRDKNKVLPLDERVELANETRDTAIFVGVSLNSGAPEENGVQTFIVTREKGVTESDPFGMASVPLSVGIHGCIVRRIGANTSDLGVTKGELDAYSRIRHPAVLLRPGFVSHERDSRLIGNTTYQTAVADGIVDGVVRYKFAMRRNKVSKAKDVSDQD